jgi:Kef-type K+ transport system membrane component KefB
VATTRSNDYEGERRTAELARPDADTAPLITAQRARTFLFYGGMVVAAVLVFFLIRSAGAGLVAPAPQTPRSAAAAGQTINTLFHALLALAVVIGTTRLVGALFVKIGQPSVMGEVCGGILLGPSLLGYLAPTLYAQLLPAGVTGFLGLYSQLGVILYLFLVGLELDLGVIRKSAHAALAISHASIVVPFLLGSALALVLYPVLSTSDIPFTVFALFFGVSLSVTALPVLARILAERNISKSHMGAVALTCAAIDDVTAWCLLALVVSIAQSRASDAIRTVVLTAAFVFLILRVVAPVVRRLMPRIDRSENLTRTSLSLVFIALLASAMMTEYIGIHGFFGAFLFGAIIPHSSRIAGELNRRLDDFVGTLLLPAFFAYTGMRTEIGLVSGLGNWLLCLTIIFVACLGKFGGTLVAARLSGLKWRDSAALGILMNTRGLVQLIVLNIGVDLGIISPRLFTMLVIMAIVTTFLTTPILEMLLRKHPWVERAPAKMVPAFGPSVHV